MVWWFVLCNCRLGNSPSSTMRYRTVLPVGLQDISSHTMKACSLSWLLKFETVWVNQSEPILRFFLPENFDCLLLIGRLCQLHLATLFSAGVFRSFGLPNIWTCLSNHNTNTWNNSCWCWNWAFSCGIHTQDRRIGIPLPVGDGRRICLLKCLVFCRTPYLTRPRDDNRIRNIVIFRLWITFRSIFYLKSRLIVK